MISLLCSKDYNKPSHILLEFPKYCSLHCHVKVERVREREEILLRQQKGTTHAEEAHTEKQKSNGNPGWQDRGNVTGIDPLHCFPLVVIAVHLCL